MFNVACELHALPFVYFHSTELADWNSGSLVGRKPLKPKSRCKAKWSGECADVAFVFWVVGLYAAPPVVCVAVPVVTC